MVYYCSVLYILGLKNDFATCMTLLEFDFKMNRAGYFQRASWVQGQLFGSTFALDLHNRRPEDLDLDALCKVDFARFNSVPFLEGDRFYASFIHVTGYSSNYYPTCSIK